MDNTTSEKPKQPSEQTQPPTQPGKVWVGVPVSVTIIVPVEVDGFDVDPGDSFAEYAGTPVIDCTKADGGGELLAAALKTAKDDQACAEAQGILMAAVHIHRKEFPTHKATLTLYKGVMEEMEF
ncbi:MAG: hypothetical protein GY832_23700 [Chloroflexi bacterium]|nr:hypothetical protein [Chloroflexota bacterium]